MVRRQSQMAGTFLLGLSLGLLAGCATVGVTRVGAPSPEAEPFERGLMRYVRGELDQAEGDLTSAVKAHSDDLRARELLQVVQREKGIASKDQAADRSLSLLEPVGPERLLEAVLGRNPEIRKAVFRVVEARAKLREANLSLSPEFSLLTRFYPSGILASLTQSISGLLQRPARMHQAEEAVLEAVADYAKVRQDVLYRALSTYLDFLEAQDLIGPLEEELKMCEEQVRVATVLAQYGLMLPQSLLAIEQGSTEVRQRLADAKGRAALALATLNGLMGREVDEPLSILKRHVAVEIPEEVRQAIATAQEQRPELKEAQAKVEEARAGRDVVATELPRVELRGTYGTSTEEGRGDFLQGFSIGARFSTPILIWPLQKARSDREEAFIRQLELEVARLLSVVSVEVVKAYEELLKAQTALRTVEKQMEAAKEARRVSQAVERWGERGDRLSLITAEAQHAEVRQRAIAQDYAVQRASLTLQRAMGVLPERVLFAQSHESASREQRETTPSPRLERALWVWRSPFLDKPQDMEFLLDFAEARRINTIFLFASTKKLLDHPEPFRAFLSLAHKRMISVHALNGEPTWIFPDQRSGAQAFIEAYLRFNRESPKEARFDAIHLDVEPHALPEWKVGKQEELASHYVEFLGWSRDRIRKEEIPLVVDIPDWFDRIAVETSSLLETVLDRVDQVAVMAYRNRAEKVIEASRAEVEQAEGKGKTVWIGLSADPADLPKASLGQPMEEKLEQMAIQVEETFRGQRSFLGVAIHDFDQYRRLILGAPVTDNPATRGSEMRTK